MKHAKKLIAIFMATLLLMNVTGVTLLAEESEPLYITYADKEYSGANASLLKLAGAASINNGLYLTDHGASQVGSAFFANKIKSTEGFSTYFSFSFTNRGFHPGSWMANNGAVEQKGADGFVFIISSAANQYGSSGAGIGYEGIANSVGIEFDSFCNDGDRDWEKSHSHIAVDLNGANIVNSEPQTYFLLPNDYFNNDGPFYAWIDYNVDSHQLEVRLDTTNVRPVEAAISTPIDLSQYAGEEYYVGFTSATGQSVEDHIINEWFFSNTYMENGIDSEGDYAMDSTAPTTPSLSQEGTIVTLGGASDGGSGLAGYEYSVDGGDWILGTSFDVTPLSGGTHTISARAVDLVGNISSMASLEVTIANPSFIDCSSGSVTYATTDTEGVVVDSGLTLSEGDDLSMARVYITDGFTAGDELLFTTAGAIMGSYDAIKGVLTFSGTDTVANYEAVLKSVKFKSTASSTTERKIVYTLGNAFYNPTKGHFYEYINHGSSITWDAAKAAAAGMSFYGFEGYLVTITSQSENDFLRDKLGVDAWIGASDNSVEGAWTWDVAAPAEEAGINFFNGNHQNGTTVEGLYANWNNGEPNGSTGENYAVMYSTASPEKVPGKWNDLANAPSEDDTVTGYIVEYNSAEGAADFKTVDIITVPGAPTAVSATAGNRQATVSFTAPAENGGSAITGYVVTVNPGGSSFTTTESPIVITGLTNGTAYTFTVKAVNGVGNSAASAASSPVRPSAPATDVSDDGSAAQSAPANQQPVIVIVNGKVENAGIEAKSTEAGKTTVTVKVNNTVIDGKIDEAIKNNPTGTGNLVQIPVADKTAAAAKVELTGDIVKKLEANHFDISVKRDAVEYILPAEELTISSIAQKLGVSEQALKDIKLEVKIASLDASAAAKYGKVAEAKGAELVFPPVQFEIAAKTTKLDGTTGDVAISRFSSYVERVIEIPAGVDPSKITTGIVFNMDGTYSHIPTEVFQKDGKWYAKLNSLTNSNYSVMWNPVTVKSVENHWSKNAVNDMASRLVVFDAQAFAPDNAITRADFAEYIVRALGLYREGSAYENKFKDVSSKGDRTLAILIANEYGIVAGYPDGTFRPDALITREEAMAMYQRAMKITKLVGTDPNRYQSYTDYKQVSSWATSYVKEVLSAHVFNGNTANTITPRSNLSYAEAAQAMKNLLVESKLINK